MEQLLNSDNKKRYYILVEVQKIQNKKNIFQLIGALKHSNQIIEEKKKK
jgi:hypothetical protein